VGGLKLMSAMINTVNAQEVDRPRTTATILRAQVIEIVEQGDKLVMGESAPYQKLRVRLAQPYDGQAELVIDYGGVPSDHLDNFQVGDKLFLSVSHLPAGSLDKADFVQDQKQVSIAGYARDRQLIWFFLFFVILVIMVSRSKGVRSLLSLGISFCLIFLVVLPLMAKGAEPVLIVTLLLLFIIPLTFYLTHGWKKQTHIAVCSTLLALGFSTLLASSLISTTKLSGLASEEAAFLSFEKQNSINLKGLLMAGIILGLLGTLDDITVTQAGLVFSLYKNNNQLSVKQLYQEAMQVGQDHISSMVNTLVLVYTGASLPLLLLFLNNPHPIEFIISQEIIVEEIVRTLVSSVGLILAAPLTTGLSVLILKWTQFKGKLTIK